MCMYQKQKNVFSINFIIVFMCTKETGNMNLFNNKQNKINNIS